ncbi:MAG TPA: hypothetical protein VJ650_15035 [Gemmatimonadaceae bacterium]|nr:hypothetical protein [Gemmatimonadaceae bacterium]
MCCLFWPTIASPAKPLDVWGIVLRRPIDPSAVEIDRCVNGRAFALRDGPYRITTDDVLLSVPHEHQDTTAVLAALDSVTACVVVSRTRHFSAVLTLRDSVVINASIFWPNTTGRPTVAGVIAEITAKHGPPRLNEHDGAHWEADSSSIYVTERGPFLASVAVTLSYAPACEWFESLVHRRDRRPRYTDPRANHC